MNDKTLALRLKRMRKDRGLTQKQLSKQIGVALSVIAGAETKRGISKTLASKLAYYFNTPIDYWLYSNDDKEFINSMDYLETTKMVIERLINENLITLDNIDKIPKDEMELITKSLLFDIKIYLKKKED